MKEVKYDKTVILYLDELTDILIEKEYFSFYDTSVEYIWDLISYVKNNINSLPYKKAPAYFSKYGKKMFYISYHRNQRTTWYILFEKTNAHFLIRYITNNHKEGQFFE